MKLEPNLMNKKFEISINFNFDKKYIHKMNTIGPFVKKKEQTNKKKIFFSCKNSCVGHHAHAQKLFANYILPAFSIFIYAVLFMQYSVFVPLYSPSIYKRN